MMFNVVGGPNCKEQKKNQKKKEKLEELYGIAILREGKCLSSTYYDVDTKLKWECKYGHQWESTPYSIKNGGWCPICAYEKTYSHKKGTIEDMQSLAKKNKGICLSDTYVNSQAKLLWECRRVINGTLILIVFRKAHGVQLVKKMRFLGNRENPSLK